MRILLIIIIFLTGCYSNRVQLPSKWRPLKYIKERPSLPLIEDGYLITIDDSVYVDDLDNWITKHDINSDIFISIMLHERVHSYRQQKFGLLKWLFLYSFDTSFRLYEEYLGHYVSLRYKKQQGLAIDKKYIADCLATAYFGMVEQSDAEKWITTVINDSWIPSEEHLPSDINE